MKESVSVIGLGQLGLPIAVAFNGADGSLLGCDPDPARQKLASEQGIRLAGVPAEAMKANVVITLLPDEPALRQLCFASGGLIEQMSSGELHLCMGTIGVGLAQELEQAHRAKGQWFGACPVFGRPDEAWARDLTAVLGVDPELPEPLRLCVLQLLASVAPRVFEVGGAASAFSLKLAGNLLIASAIASMTEAFELARRHRVPDGFMHAVITSKLFTGPVYQGVGNRLAHATTAQQQPEPAGFTIRLGLKDLELCAEAADACGLNMPMANAVRSRLRQVAEAGFGRHDWAELPALIQKDAITR